MGTKRRKISNYGNLKKMPCSGCGRHAKYVTADVHDWFCNHCFTMNGNYNRYKQGLPMILPLENIKVKDILLGANGKEYKVLGRGTHVGEDTFYPVMQLCNKEIMTLGDFFFVRKVND